VLISGVPKIVGTQAVQMIGVGPNGFLAGVVYRWIVIATTIGSRGFRKSLYLQVNDFSNHSDLPSRKLLYLLYVGNRLTN
jgi:hypothetical protein